MRSIQNMELSLILGAAPAEVVLPQVPEVYPATTTRPSFPTATEWAVSRPSVESCQSDRRVGGGGEGYQW